MHPVGPLNPKVYWVRRVAIVVVAVALLVGLVWFLANRGSGSSTAASVSSTSTNASAAPTLTGVLAASSGATRSPAASASPSPTSGSPVSQSPAVSDSAAAPTDTAAVSAPPATAPTAPPTDAPPVTDPAAAPPVDTTAAAPPVDPAPVPTAEPTPAPPPPSYDVDGKLLCPDSAIVITAITSAPSFPAGGQPTLGMTVTNSGAEACKRDVSGTLQTFTVLGTDGSRKWSTADCFPGEGTEVRELAPGQELKYTIKWSGTSSEPGCAGDRAVVPPGDYQLVAQLGALASAPAPFAITG